MGADGCSNTTKGTRAARSPLRQLTAAGSCLALMIALTSCTGSGHGKATAAASGGPVKIAGARAVSVPVASGRSATLRADGVTVTVPVGAVTSTGRLTASPAPSPGPHPSGVAFATPVWNLHLSGATLRGHVGVTMTVPSQRGYGTAGAPRAAMLGYFDEHAHRWAPVPATYTPGPGGSATVTYSSPHLSLWSAFIAPASAVAAWVRDALTWLVGVNDQIPQPVAPGQNQARRDGLAATSSHGGLVKWSFGEDGDGAGQLVVGNNRHFAIELDYPPSWSVRRDAWSDIDQHIVTLAARSLTVAPTGQKAIIVPGGEKVTFTVPPGSSGRLSAQPSSPAYFASAIGFGLQTLAMVMGKLPGTPAASESTTVKVLKLAEQSHDCVISDQNLWPDPDS